MRPRPVALGALAALLTAGAGLAAAQEQATSSITVQDAAADARTSLDLRRFTLARGSDGRLRATFTVAAPFEDAALAAEDGPPGSLCVRLWTTTTAPDEPPTFLVCATADADGELRGSVLRERANRLPERVGRATVSRPSRRTLTLRFSQTSIGRPAAFTVGAETTRPGCPRVSCIDTAPDAPAVQRLVLRGGQGG